MITIISGTNRQDSMTLKMSEAVFKLFQEQGANVTLLSLEGLDIFERNLVLQQVENEYLVPAQKFVFVLPEYNGSFPGILKLLMDNSEIKSCWWHKKAMLIGVADGRAGNLRGLDHMTNILNYLKVNVHYNKLPFSRIKEEIDDEGNLLKTSSIDLLKKQVIQFIEY